MDKVTVIGGGSWGSAIANILASKSIPTTIYMRDMNQYKYAVTTRKNPKYLKDFTFNSNLSFSNSFKSSLEGSNYIILAVPTNSCRKIMMEIANLGIKNSVIINLAKGLEEGSHLRISEIAETILPHLPFAVLSGPSHAEEVAFEIPTTVVVCSEDRQVTLKAQELFSTESFRVYAQDDLIGVEIGGALKNIIALAAGLSDGLGFGDNTKAALMTRGIYEIQKLGIKLGAKAETFNGLSGIGDLIVTCTSTHSRNWRFGNYLGQGLSILQAQEKVEMVVEGFKTTKAAYELAKLVELEMPITEKLFGVLYNNIDPKEAVIELMNRQSKKENEDIYL